MIKKIRNLTGDKIYAKNASWSFDKKVPKTFTKHISKSVLGMLNTSTFGSIRSGSSVKQINLSKLEQLRLTARYSLFT